MMLAPTADPMAAREKFAVTVRSSKRKEVIDAKRSRLKYWTSPAQCQPPNSGKSFRFATTPIDFLGDLIAMQAEFTVYYER